MRINGKTGEQKKGTVLHSHDTDYTEWMALLTPIAPYWWDWPHAEQYYMFQWRVNVAAIDANSGLPYDPEQKAWGQSQWFPTAEERRYVDNGESAHYRTSDLDAHHAHEWLLREIEADPQCPLYHLLTEGQETHPRFAPTFGPLIAGLIELGRYLDTHTAAAPLWSRAQIQAAVQRWYRRDGREPRMTIRKTRWTWDPVAQQRIRSEEERVVSLSRVQQKLLKPNVGLAILVDANDKAIEREVVHKMAKWAGLPEDEMHVMSREARGEYLLRFMSPNERGDLLSRVMESNFKWRHIWFDLLDGTPSRKLRQILRYYDQALAPGSLTLADTSRAYDADPYYLQWKTTVPLQFDAGKVTDTSVNPALAEILLKRAPYFLPMTPDGDQGRFYARVDDTTYVVRVRDEEKQRTNTTRAWWAEVRLDDGTVVSQYLGPLVALLRREFTDNIRLTGVRPAAGASPQTDRMQVSLVRPDPDDEAYAQDFPADSPWRSFVGVAPRHMLTFDRYHTLGGPRGYQATSGAWGFQGLSGTKALPCPEPMLSTLRQLNTFFQKGPRYQSEALRNDLLPPYSAARGMWIGEPSSTTKGPRPYDAFAGIERWKEDLAGNRAPDVKAIVRWWKSLGRRGSAYVTFLPDPQLQSGWTYDSYPSAR
jgi:hypothetical protein